MSRRFILAIAMSVFATTAVSAAEQAMDRACTRDGAAHLVPAHDELTALFARREAAASATETTTTENATVEPMGPPEVLMARIGADGKLVVVCVDNETAARRFLDASSEAITRVKVK